MPSTFFGVGIASSGMATYNAWLNTTAHNISNVKTKGYSKQVVNQSAREPISLKTSYGMVGAGVDAVSIDSLRDVYFDNKYRLSNSDYGRYSTNSTYLQDMETLLYAKDAESGSITNSMDKLFKSITELTTDASDVTKRTNVVGYAGMLTDYIREAATNLKTLQTEINNKIANAVDKINAYAEEIASLNQQIETLEVYGTAANDLRDRRATIIDDLSQIADVKVIESVPKEGLTQFLVYIDNAVLVDTNEYNTLNYRVQQTYSNMNDAENLYELVWSNGMKFGIHDTDLGGELQALFELRDGNNGERFEGVLESAAEGDKTVVITDTNDFGQNLFKLEIPKTDGFITIGHREYAYESFSYDVDAAGNYKYTFQLKDALSSGFTNEPVSVGDAVGFRGIPYYMAQLNEFVRTFSFHFNQVQTTGYDLNDNQGKQMFIAQDEVNGMEMNFDQVTVRNGKAYDGEGNVVAYSFSSLPGTLSNGYEQTNYYRMTALNTSIDKEMKLDASLLACSDEQFGGKENGENLKLMSKLDADPEMFRQGQASSFLQIMTSTLGVDSRKARENEENALNIRHAVEQRRASKSGVDEDEEAQNLVICQNLLSYQYKVLSVMNEVLNKLINDTAV